MMKSVTEKNENGTDKTRNVAPTDGKPTPEIVKDTVTTRGDEEINDILLAHLPKKFTWVAYAVNQGGNLLASGAVSGKSNQPASLIGTNNVASVSKIFCAVSIMKLVEKGLVSLDEPVVRYLPAFHTLDKRSDHITLRHCLNHSSGLPGTMWRGFAVSRWTPGYYDDVLDYFSRCTLKADPGAYSVYCNDGFTLAEMVVAAVTGEDYGTWCIENITGLLGMESTRLSSCENASYPVIAEGDHPAERMQIGGAAGFTTTMEDLCRFGRIFLADSPVLSRSSVAEMAKRQGRTFCRSDCESELYGLGWDNVSLKHPDFDWGEGVCAKGGNSFQYTTAFWVCPRYDLVVALSHTHDCGFQPETFFISMRAAEKALSRQGINVTRGAQLMTEEDKKLFAGPWLAPSETLGMSGGSAWADFYCCGEERKNRAFTDYKFDGEKLVTPLKDETRWVEESDGHQFLCFSDRVRRFPELERAESQPLEPATWEARLGTKWIACDLDSYDLVIHEVLTTFTVDKLPDYRGVYLLRFTGLDSSGVYESFDAPVRALDDRQGEGFLHTPRNGGRDALHPLFEPSPDHPGEEICHVGSYAYRSLDHLPAFDAETFVWPSKRRENGVYRLDKKLEALPALEDGHRILVLDDQRRVAYDSLYPKSEYKPIENGYLIFV